MIYNSQIMKLEPYVESICGLEKGKELQLFLAYSGLAHSGIDKSLMQIVFADYLDDIRYFTEKLARSMHIPKEYLTTNL